MPDFNVTASGMSDYTVNGQKDPALTLTRGHTYTFDINVPDHPFLIKTVPETGSENTFDDGVTNNGATGDTLTFTVPASAPARLYYQCQYHDVMGGTINVVAATSAAVPATTMAVEVLLAVALGAAGWMVLARRRWRSGLALPSSVRWPARRRPRR